MTYDSGTNTATLNPSSDLSGSTAYTVTVDASVADASNNTLGTDDTWTFTTAAVLSTLTDTTTAQFGAGSQSSTYVAATGDGEVTLNPTIGVEFSGTSLPSGWSSTPWSAGGSSTVSGGALTVDGARANPTAAPSFGPGTQSNMLRPLAPAASRTSALARISRWAARAG